jgi:UDP-N-acetylmuramoylalanine--D-glutamate ligase
MTRLARWRAGGREVAVLGLGRSGVAVTRLLRRHEIPVYASDLSARREPDAAMLRDECGDAVHVDVGHHDLDRIARAAALVLSPGVPPDVPPVEAARRAGVEVVAELQVGIDALPDVPWIGVTGTNGKTTTTALIGALLEAAGRRAVTCGNIGTPVSGVAIADPPPEWMAVELSSFQLHDAPDLHPAVGLLTNLAPDHLDRYPDLASYYADKRRLFASAHPGSIWVSNLDDADSRAMVHSVAGRHLTFSVRHRADAWYDRAGDRLMIAERELLPRREFPPLGDHNVANALGAALATHATGVPLEAIATGLRAFVPLDHRMEPVATVRDVLYLNDSKATNVSSTRVALEAMDRPYVLLLGGRHKGEPYSALLPSLGPHAVAVVAYGEAGDLVVADLGAHHRVYREEGFEEAVAHAARLAPRGGAVLLSPACSSYDQFNNYEERGAAFRALVRAL